MSECGRLYLTATRTQARCTKPSGHQGPHKNLLARDDKLAHAVAEIHGVMNCGACGRRMSDCDCSPTVGPVQSVAAALRPDDWSWTKFFMGMAQYVATASKDPSTKTGAVIVDRERRVVSIGYNGFPRGVEDTPERYNDRPLKYKLIVHCEENAILNAPLGVRGCVLFSTKFPCSECAKVIIQSGIRYVVHAAHGTNASDAAWAEDARISNMALREAGLLVWDDQTVPPNLYGW
jgi:dCMP deaminase